MSTVGVIGLDGRTTAMRRALDSSDVVSKVSWLGPWKGQSPREATEQTLRAVAERGLDFVVVGPEEPLGAGIVDALEARGVPCIGPSKKAAQIETSKAFTRRLLEEFNIPGNPEYRVFTRDENGIAEYLSSLSGFVVKPDGLTGGKGVRVSGEHLRDIAEGVRYCGEVFQAGHPCVVVEERLEGEEFCLQSFCDGKTLVHMPVVQDHKRAYNGDSGPNTGGMGSYSCADHSLPFLRPEHIEAACSINENVAAALRNKTGTSYRGILYGGFMLTSQGLRLVEYNARFGDPEALNVLTLLDSDFGAICQGIAGGTLNSLPIKFRNLATVCKYIVPEGYPASPASGEIWNIPSESKQLKIYYAAVEQKEDKVFLTGSRAMAFVGVHSDLYTAAEIAEEAAASVAGPVFHRTDIGTRTLVEKRVRHIEALAQTAQPMPV